MREGFHWIAVCCVVTLVGCATTEQPPAPAPAATHASTPRPRPKPPGSLGLTLPIPGGRCDIESDAEPHACDLHIGKTYLQKDGHTVKSFNDFTCRLRCNDWASVCGKRFTCTCEDVGPKVHGKERQVEWMGSTVLKR